MRISSSTGGIGVTAYGQFPTEDKYYRLRRYDGATAFELVGHRHLRQRNREDRRRQQPIAATTIASVTPSCSQNRS